METLIAIFFHGEVEGVTYLVILVKISAKLGGKCHVLCILIDDVFDSKWNKAVSKSSSYTLSIHEWQFSQADPERDNFSITWMGDGMIVDLEMAKLSGPPGCPSVLILLT